MPGTWITDSSITLAILAGGASTRMGRAKSALTLQGQPVLAYLLERLSWHGPTLLVTAAGREHPPGTDLFDQEVLDAIPDEGPLRGVLTALRSAKTSRVIALTVDMPCLLLEHLQWMIETSNNLPEHRGLMLQRAINGDMQVEPFPFLCRVDAADLIAERLASGRRSVHSLKDVPSFEVLSAPTDWHRSVWTNLNTPEDLSAFTT